MDDESTRRFSGQNASASSPSSSSSSILACTAKAAVVKRFVRQQVPDDILQDEALNAAMKSLPSNYNFEIHKTVWRLRQADAKQVGSA
jgi:2-(3-amino-3-carboxypropyl)histidine synthase